jgi:hypothetical protein
MDIHAKPLINLIDKLDSLGNGAPPLDSYIGICGYLRCGDPELRKLAKYLMTQWPKYSGVEAFPVPHPTLECSAAYLEGTDLWEGEYGATRRELCLFLRDELSKVETE